jgi:hypothetical protein
MKIKFVSFLDKFLLKRMFGTIDSRPLAAFRIVFSLLLLKDAFYHLFLAKWFYSDRGIIPRVALFDGLVRQPRFSLMDAIGQDWLAFCFFLLWIAILIGLLFGYRTRLMAVLNYVVILSIHERNGYILTGADTAMRVFSFWMMFAPIAQHYALDVLRRKSPPEQAFALPARLLQWQLIIIYVTTFYLKLLEPIWLEGDALFYVLQLDSMLLPPGILLQQAPNWVLRLLTHFTLFMEVAIPLLLAFPLRRWFIALAFALALMLHGGIALTLAIPDFSLVMLIAFIAHFPPSWFDGLDKHIYRLLRVNEIRRSLRWLLRHLPYPTPHIPAIQLELGSNRGISLYRVVLSLTLIPLMALVIWWNAIQSSYYAEDYGYRPLAPMPVLLEDVVWYSGLWQWWDMFAPLPLQYDGYLIIPGHFEDGTTFDLRTQQPIPDRELRPHFGPLMRFYKLEEHVEQERYEQILLWWGRYYCHIYNVRRAAPVGERLTTLEIIFVYQNSHAPGAEPNPIEQDILWEHYCFG